MSLLESASSASCTIIQTCCHKMEKDLRNKNTGRDSKRQSADVEEKSPDNRYTKKRPL